MKTTVLLILGIWIGLLLGISFIEAPLKFRAPGITTKLGLGIGKLVFSVSNKVQLGILLVVFLYSFLEFFKLDTSFKLFTSLLSSLMIIQTFYLIPALDARAELILNDYEAAQSYHHIIFIIMEVIKIVTLVFLFINLHKHE